MQTAWPWGVVARGKDVLDGIHAQKDYVELEGVFIDLELGRHDPSLLGAD